MLTKDNIEQIKANRKQLEKNRLKLITLVVLSEYEHPLTGEIITEDEQELGVKSIVTERSSRTAPELVRQDGAEVREGDLWFSVSRDELERVGLTDTESYDSIMYCIDDDRRYRVVSWDRKGLGEMNRLEMLGKVVT